MLSVRASTSIGSGSFQTQAAHHIQKAPRIPHPRQWNDERETFWRHAQEMVAIRFRYGKTNAGSPAKYES
jgi:hypothetical protein